MLSWSWAVVYLDTTDKYLFRFDSIKSSTEWHCCLGGQYRSDPRRVLEEFWLHKNVVRHMLHVVLSNQRNLCHLDGTFQSWDIFRLWIFSIDDHFWAYGRVSETGFILWETVSRSHESLFLSVSMSSNSDWRSKEYEWAKTVSQRSHKRPHPYLRII